MATIVGAFTNAGSPATGLPVTIRIRRTDTQALVVTDASATEQGDGAYSYDFTPLEGVNYSIRMDGGASLSAADRYLFGAMSGNEALNADTKVPETHQYLGLKSGTSAVHSPTAFSSGSISQVRTQVGDVVTVSRS